MKAQAEAQKSIHTALDKSVQTLKMQLKFKVATIAQLEKKPSLKLPSAGNNTQQDTVAPLKEEIKMLEAQLSGHTHPEVVRQTQLLQVRAYVPFVRMAFPSHGLRWPGMTTPTAFMLT